MVSDGILLRAQRPLALRWVGHRPSDEMTAMLGVMRAARLEEFRAALGGFAVPGQTMVAVEAGPPGAPAGSSPRICRGARTGLWPGWSAPPDEVWSWTTWCRGTTFPQAEEAIVVSANDRPPETPVPVGFFFSPPDRARRLRALLDTGALVTPEAMRALQLDVHGSRAPWRLRDALLPRLRPSSRQRRAVQALAIWDGAYDAGSAGALVFEVLAASLARRLLGKDKLALLSAIWTGRALIGAADCRRAAPVLARRTAGRGTRAAPLPDLGRRAPACGCATRSPRCPVSAAGSRPPGTRRSGGNDTLNKTGHGPVHGRHRVTYGACARHVSDLADPDANWFVLLGGQDGWLGSANATDQVALWRAGEAIRVPLRAEAARAWPHHTTLLPGMIDATPLLRIAAARRLGALDRMDPVQAQAATLAGCCAAPPTPGSGATTVSARSATSTSTRHAVPLRHYEAFWRDYLAAGFPVAARRRPGRA